MIDTFSVNSLKILDNSPEEFKKKYILGTEIISKNKETEEGNKFHGLICYYLKNFEIEKFETSLLENEKTIWNNLKTSEIINFALNSDKKYIEQPFFVRFNSFYLTGRFDAVVLNQNKFTILDWKMKNLPKNPESDLQTVVYLYCASILFKSENIEMIYYSLSKGNSFKINFKKGLEDNINSVISKYQNYRD